ncbi:Cfr10I/Bse634I family restriction endonuclease [Alishewanella sp. SMS8]|uniref:Cfr10I/Bse634I family restriction endonuclease n=1 Tax=Alishewanella sp. SMS8 TaxID=2994676 RepID=UPI002741CAE9|nr:Cfr10I/Bse634I family restriction endonuclease [Alishewanella sp. SMS8]MDP5459617.1 Cfr10I/Bse634I family restriction endonuclease [Alishewanella sp. SMS8]
MENVFGSLQGVFTRNSSGKVSIKKEATFVAFLENILQNPNLDISKKFKLIDSILLKQQSEMEKSALSNSHGDWYEWIIAASAWNYRIDNNKKYLLALLPNKRQFDVSTLYKNNLSLYIDDLRLKVQASDVELISSNPDFAILSTQALELPDFFNKRISSIDTEVISMLNSAYTYFIEKCKLDDIHGYLSVKSSLRPDRRLQIAHEGSLMKALYVHLQTRDWIIEPKGLKYYAASTKVSSADISGLKTVATHSITNVSSKPQRAVDDVFVINNVSDSYKAFEVILSD